jgi:CRISPR-associated protein Cas2
MTLNAVKTWLVAYDIRAPRRLKRVHRFLRREGLAVQYSAFCVDANDLQLLQMLVQLEKLLDSSFDDLRAYHMPARCPVWCMGRQGWPEGIHVSPLEAVRLLGTSLSTESSGTLGTDARVSEVP